MAMTQLIPQQLNRWRLAIFVCICLLTISSTVSFNVTLRIEDPKVERSNPMLDYLGIETFDESEQLVNDTYETKFGNATGPISGTYDQLYLIQRSGTIGAGNRGMVAVAWEDHFYTLALTSAGDIGINYFGLWIDTLEDHNKLEFYKQKQPIHQITGNEMAELIKGRPDYIKPGNTRGSFFLNVYFNDTQIDEVRFSHSDFNTLGFYTDNHSVGYIRDKPKPTEAPTSSTHTPTLSTHSSTLSTHSSTPSTDATALSADATALSTVATTTSTSEPKVPGVLFGSISGVAVLVAFVGVGALGSRYLAKPRMIPMVSAPSEMDDMGPDLSEDQFLYPPGQLPPA